jgi:hypothetical protein
MAAHLDTSEILEALTYVIRHWFISQSTRARVGGAP